MLARTLRKLYAHFDTPPEAVQFVNLRFYMLLNVASTLAWMLHAAWAVLFLVLKIYPLALIQLGSIVCYIIAIVLNRQGYHKVAACFALAELVVHQIIAVQILGWDAGFQYYIPVSTIFPFLLPNASLVWKWTTFSIAALGFLYIEFFLRSTTDPMYHPGRTVILSLDIINILMAFGFFTVWAYYFTLSVNRSQVIIEAQTRELAVAEHAIAQAKMEQELQIQARENKIITAEKERYEELLLNILPYEIAQELKEHGKSTPRMFQSVTVMFTDFKGFTKISEKLTPEELVSEIDICFKAFDHIIGKYNIEKIKTIGDSYMAVSGLPVINPDHAVRVVHAALEMRDFIAQHNAAQRAAGKQVFEMRVGVHTGAVVAGIVGVKKFAYDIWGDTVNIASRMESSCEVGKVNISGATYAQVAPHFTCSYRGKIQAKNMDDVDMYFVDGLAQ